MSISKNSDEPSTVNTELCSDCFSNTFGHPFDPVTVMIDWLQLTLVKTYTTSYRLQRDKRGGS